MIRGPYMNDDGDWWVAVEDASFREARAAILGCLSYGIPEDGTLVYKGKHVTMLCDGCHEVGPECNPTCSRRVLAYHFVENRRW
jgi:hypothetical protein